MPPARSVTFTMSRVIPAPAEVCYDIIADYNEGHPSILPRPWFGPLTVESGGIGAGTRIRFEMTVLGRTRVGRAVVTEPEPGRVLVETDDEAGVVTTFTVDRTGSASARVTFSTTMRSGGWLRASIERLLVPRLLRPIYAAELALLDKRAVERITAAAAVGVAARRGPAMPTAAS